MNPYSNTKLQKAPASKPEDPWTVWSKNKTPQGNAALITAYQPQIEKAATTFGDGSAAARSHAKLLLLNAAETYQPGHGTAFDTHAFNHLKGLQRFTAQASNPVHIPERVSLDALSLKNAASELTDNLGRTPSDDELADHTGIPVSRIRYVRKSTPAILAASFFDTDADADAGGNLPAIERQSSLIRKLVHDDLNPVDQQIMDMTLQQMQNQEIGRKLNLSPGRVSQRKAAIQQILDAAERGEL